MCGTCLRSLTDDNNDDNDNDDNEDNDDEEEEKSSSSEEAEQQNSSQFEAAVYAVTACVFLWQLSQELLFLILFLGLWGRTDGRTGDTGFKLHFIF